MKKIIIGSICFLFLWNCKETAKKADVSDEKEGSSKQRATIASEFSIQIFDDEALQLIDSEAEIEVWASGFTWTEGPVWVEQGEFLLFSDIPNNKIYKLDTHKDTITYLHPSGYTGSGSYGEEPGSNGLLIDKTGKLVVLQHGDRRVAQMNAPLEAPESNFITRIDNYKGKRFNSPNDAVFDQEGNLYFTDPPYGLPLKMEDPRKELDFQGVYCLLSSGELLLLDKLSKPNGIALSPDGSQLYVAVSDPDHAVWYRYTVTAPGQVEQKEIFYDATDLVGKDKEQGLPDGMKINKEGYIFATGPGGVWIFNDQAKALAKIRTGQLTSNCALTTDGKRLFMTADDHILSVELK